jgi:GDP-L-fucose synthase
VLDGSERILVLGHRGLVGAAFVRALRAAGHENLLLASSRECDLRDAHAAACLLADSRPDLVILAAAQVGGINANRTRPAEFIYDNLAIQTNVIHSCASGGVQRLLFLGSSCIYPRECPQPMREEYLLTGPLEPTNEGYAVAKIAGIKMAQMYHEQYGLGVLCPIPCNLYGPGDSFDLERSHVLSALVRRYCDAKHDGADSVTLWGTGSARREFMHVDDMVRACLLLLDEWSGPETVNVGVGSDVTISNLAAIVARATGYIGETHWDSSMPEGMPRKCLDISRLAAIGFAPQIDLERGVREMIAEYLSGRGSDRSRTQEVPL